MGTTIQMYASAAPANALAVIDVPEDGILQAVDWSIAPAASFTADILQEWSLSFGSTHAHQSNDARGVISHMKFMNEFGAAAAAMLGHLNKYIFTQNLTVNAGERIFLHASGSAISMVCVVLLYFDFQTARRAAVRR